MTQAVPSRSMPEAAAVALPRKVGPYTLFEPIGRGGMAELFLARAETELGATRLAVVKLILPAYADDPKFASMLVHEGKLAARLSHRHIVNVFDLGEDEGRPYIAMEYVEGFDLNALLRRCTQRGEGLPADHALGIVADVLEGLDYAHRKRTECGEPLGIVHRDVSPSNVLISYEGEVKLCDFGIAHANDVVRESEEILQGKAGYMSPEHARGESLDARADVFAAGIILWELLVGRRLYKPSAEVSLLEQARRAEIPPIPNRGLPHHRRIERIARKALARDRDERYPTAEAFFLDLEDYLAKAGLLSSRLKLGAWMEATFGTELVEQRRASESRLPKSNPPPRSSTMRVRALGATASPIAPPPLFSALRAVGRPAGEPLVPPAPRVPRDLLTTTPVPEDAIEGFPASMTIPVAVPSAAQSLAGATMDVEPSSPEVSAAGGLSRAHEASDEEILAWARRRGYVSFLVFFLVAVAVAVIWGLTR
jgi:serine/threonine-protein kinase